MASPTDIIELNGKRYDAQTGHLISVPHAKTDKKAAKPQAKKSATKTAKKIKVTHHKTPKASKPHRTIHHRPERAKTLMRQAVKKPEPVQKAVKQPTVHRKPSTSRLQPDPERLERAKRISKHQAVSRFGGVVPTSSFEPSIKPIITELPLQPEPVPIADDNEQIATTQPAPDSSSPSFERAIEQATSHTEPRAKRRNKHQRASQKLGISPRITSFSAAALAAVLLTGFIAYQNIPNLSMRIAAQRAGVAAELPGYQPPGFGLNGPIEYTRGQITLQFRSHSDDRAFRLRQTASDWDSSALLKNYLVPEYSSFQVRQTEGKTVYLYDDHNATWVDNGVWYQVEGESALNTDQLLRLAASM